MFDKDLIRKINNGRCLAFVGSGSSCEMGYPSWEQLAQLTYAELGKAGRISDITSYKKYLDGKEYPELFRQAERDLGGRSALLGVVKPLLVPDKRRPGTLHELIAKSPFAGYLTTNYDDEIETHLSTLGEHFAVIGNRQQDFYAWRDGASRLVQKVHGDFNNPDSLILTSADYRHAYVEDGGKYFRDRLCNIFAMFDIFIIGHSLSDPDIDYVLKLARDKRGPQHPIYMVAADFTKADEREFLEKYNIVLVQYSNRDSSHLELRRMLKTVDRFIATRKRVWRSGTTESRPMEEVEAAIAVFLYRRLQGVQGSNYLAPLVLSGLQLADKGRTARSDVMSLPMLRGVVTDDERYKDAVDETIGNLLREDLVAVIDEDVEITDTGRARVEEYRVVRKTEVDQAYGQFTLNVNRIFGALNGEQVEQCRKLAEEVIVDSFASRGSTMAGKVFSGRTALPDELSDIFGLVSKRAVEIADMKLRGAFIEAMHEFVVEPNEAQRRYLASVSQGYFLYHLLGLDPKCAEVRRSIFQKTLWVCDSSVVLPLVASGCHNHEYAVELFRMLIGENAMLYTTRRLLQEAWEHLDWAVRFMQKNAIEPLAHLYQDCRSFCGFGRFSESGVPVTC